MRGAGCEKEMIDLNAYIFSKNVNWQNYGEMIKLR